MSEGEKSLPTLYGRHPERLDAEALRVHSGTRPYTFQIDRARATCRMVNDLPLSPRIRFPRPSRLPSLASGRAYSAVEGGIPAPPGLEASTAHLAVDVYGTMPVRSLNRNGAVGQFFTRLLVYQPAGTGTGDRCNVFRCAKRQGFARSLPCYQSSSQANPLSQTQRGKVT